jgi:hypothetical protein
MDNKIKIYILPSSAMSSRVVRKGKNPDTLSIWLQSNTIAHRKKYNEPEIIRVMVSKAMRKSSKEE